MCWDFWNTRHTLQESALQQAVLHQNSHCIEICLNFLKHISHGDQKSSHDISSHMLYTCKISSHLSESFIKIISRSWYVGWAFFSLSWQYLQLIKQSAAPPSCLTVLQNKKAQESSDTISCLSDSMVQLIPEGCGTDIFVHSEFEHKIHTRFIHKANSFCDFKHSHQYPILALQILHKFA